MKCFIHGAKEAVAVCMQCGKAMCSNCSAYNGHTGICPECRKEGFLREIIRLKDKDKNWGKVVAKRWCLTILFSWTIIGLIIGICTIIASEEEREKDRKRIEFLQGEVLKLEKATISHGEGVI